MNTSESKPSSVHAPPKVVDMVGASLTEVKLTVAVAVVCLAVSPAKVLVFNPSFRVKVTVRARLDGLSEVLLNAIARRSAWVAVTVAEALRPTLSTVLLAPKRAASIVPMATPL